MSRHYSLPVEPPGRPAGGSRSPRRCALAAALVVLAAAATGSADVLEFEDKDQWIAAAGPFSTADFTGFPHATVITDQYADLGVIFTDGNDFVVCCSETTYPEDGAGMAGIGDINVSFDTPQHWIAVDYPGVMQFELYSGGESIYLSSQFFSCPAVGCFAGLISYQPFVSARIIAPGGDADIDDLHFGPGNSCPWDLDDTAQVSINDFLTLLAQWGTDPAGPPDFDGDGDVGIVDFLELLANWGPCPHFSDCNGNGIYDLIDLINATSPDCNGNATPDECDVATGASPDFNGNGIPDECEAAPNDTCENATVIFDGATPVLTFGATTGPVLTICEGVGEDFHNDVWFLYTPPCTGIATFSFCNDANFDTLLALYVAGNCGQVINPLACSNDAPGCGQTSEVQQLVAQGIPYLLRVGGMEPGGGFGTLTISCEP